MTVSKVLYSQLYLETCRGMGCVRRGSSSRYELYVKEPTLKQWNIIKELTNATGQDLEGFLQGARGNYTEETLPVEYEMFFNETLPGEIFSIVYQQSNQTDHGEIELLKLDGDHYLVIDSKNSPLTIGAVCMINDDISICKIHSVCIPNVGIVHVSHIAFKIPTIFHRLLDVALLPGYRQSKTAANIMPLYDWLLHVLPKELQTEQLTELFELTAKLGVSTYVIRRIIDCITSQSQNAL